MYLDIAKSEYHNKEYTRALLRTTYWDKENGSPKHKTIANLGECTFEEITAIKLALQHKDNRKEQRYFDKGLYKLRHLVENAFLKIKG